jgi:hypothetical protein
MEKQEIKKEEIVEPIKEELEALTVEKEVIKLQEKLNKEK